MPLEKDDIRNGSFKEPTIVGYNRLEGIPRSSDYRKSVKAEVHDALWTLCRQWQMGEFDAEDTGSAIKTNIVTQQYSMNQLSGKNTSTYPYENFTPPLEMAVERERVLPDLMVRIESGKLLKEILIKHGLTNEMQQFVTQFNLGLIEKNVNAKIATPEEVILFNQIKSDPVLIQLFDSLKFRVIDGYAVYSLFNEKPNTNYTTWISIKFTNPNVDKAVRDFTLQYKAIYESDGIGAWKTESLNYNFSLQDQTSGLVLSAQEYSNGNLDWYDFDIKQMPLNKGVPVKNTFIPASVTYPGMPKARWWEMEESTVNFGKINVTKPDLLSLLLIDFALIYGNDWLIIPYPMEVNKVCEIKGILVTDVFGYHTYIPPVSDDATIKTDKTKSWEKWSLFQQSIVDSADKKPLFYLAPSLLKAIEQEPLEKISLFRDEMANMVWAFENIIPGALGKGEKGYEIHLRESFETDSQTTPPRQDSPMKYVLGSEVPFYQIPLIPVNVPNVTPVQMRLQRGRMRIQDGSTARGVLLNENDPQGRLFIREEEVPRSGVNVIRRWQRTRWINGVICQWIGREKETGKGEGTSGLQFDQAVY